MFPANSELLNCQLHTIAVHLEGKVTVDSDVAGDQWKSSYRVDLLRPNADQLFPFRLVHDDSPGKVNN